MPYIASASNKTHSGTVIYMLLGSASVSFKDSLSWHSCDGGTSGLSVSGEEGGENAATVSSEWEQKIPEVH